MIKNKNEKNLWKVFSIILVILFLILVIVLLNNNSKSEQFRENNIIIPKQFSGIIYGIEDNIAIIKLDLTNPIHVDVYKRLDGFCTVNGIKECQGFKFG